MGAFKLIGRALPLLGQIQNQQDIKKDLKSAEDNLLLTKERGVDDTAGDELKNSYKMALDQYKARQEAAKSGYSSEELANARNDINKTQTSQMIAGREAGGGQMSKYLGAVLSANKGDSLLSLAASDAALKLQKQTQADSQLGNVQSGALGLQTQKNFDLGNYRSDLSAAGKAISDLRMQKMTNRQGIYNTAGNELEEIDAEKTQSKKDFVGLVSKAV
jgi:hypothetical protein